MAIRSSVAWANLVPELDRSYVTTFRRLVRIFRSRGFTADEADEFAQEAITRALSHLDKHGRRGADLMPLLNTIAKNLIVERFRTGGREVPVEFGTQMVGDVPDPADVVARRDHARRLRHALDDLPDRQRRALLMTLEGLAPADIARELGVKRNAADAILHRARRQLALKLKESRDGAWGVAGLLGLRVRNATRRLAGWSYVPEVAGTYGQALAGLALAAILVVSPSAAVGTSDVTDANTPRTMRAVTSTADDATPVARPIAGLGPRANAADRPSGDGGVHVDLGRQQASIVTYPVDPTTGQRGPLGIEISGEDNGGSTTGSVINTGVEAVCSPMPALCEGS
jgi:RNA polymerase sigma factor (sigma-70 family)